MKQIYHNAEEPYAFPLLKAYEARTREIASYKPDRLLNSESISGKNLRGKDESFSFDEGRFDPDDDDDDHHHHRRADDGGGVPEADLGSHHTADDSPSDKRDDYWVRFEEEKS